jgi:hypothetical protein
LPRAIPASAHDHPAAETSSAHSRRRDGHLIAKYTAQDVDLVKDPVNHLVAGPLPAGL